MAITTKNDNGRFLESIAELVLEVLRDEDVVGCNTGLACVHYLAPENALGGHLEVACRVDDNG